MVLQNVAKGGWKPTWRVVDFPCPPSSWFPLLYDGDDVSLLEREVFVGLVVVPRRPGVPGHREQGSLGLIHGSRVSKRVDLDSSNTLESLGLVMAALRIRKAFRAAVHTGFATPEFRQSVSSICGGYLQGGGSRSAWHRLHTGLRNSSSSVERRTAIFLAGLPGAGKSSFVSRKFTDDKRTVILDLDHEISKHPKFDPINPAEVYNDQHAYAWANRIIEGRFQSALRDENLQTIVVDGTGTKLGRGIQRMRDAREAGWWIKLLALKVPVETALERNEGRSRKVPVDILLDYESRLQKAVEAELEFADEFEEIDTS